MKIVGTSPSVLTCLVCGQVVQASLGHTRCRCGQVSSFGARMYVSRRRHGPASAPVPAKLVSA